MRLATLRDGTRDGALVVVDARGERFLEASAVAKNLQSALDEWQRAEPELRALSLELEREPALGHPLDVTRLAAPLPRAYEWLDGSTFLNHVLLARRARGAEPPHDFETNPLVYQGGSGVLLGPRDPLTLLDPAFGLDFEAELAVVLADVPRGTRSEDADRYVRLLLLANDVTYRELVPSELAKGFGFLVSKPPTAFSPFAVTKDELGAAYHHGRAYLKLRSTYNGSRVGEPETGPEMHFSFCDLIAHASRTRALCAGTILGSGTVSNRARERGASCLVELRARETLEHGAPTTPYMKVGDRIVIEAFDASGRSVFGAIDQVVEPA